MNSNPTEIEVTDSGKSVNLPKPDAANITVLTPKLPNKPILPWTHFDSPWLETEEGEETEVSAEQETEAENLENQPQALTDPEKPPEASETQMEASASTPPETPSETPPNSSQLPENEVSFQIISENQANTSSQQ